MYHFSIVPSSKSYIWLYEKCFTNNDFCKMLYNPTPLKGRGTEYFYNCPNHIKLILLQKNKPIGFIHISFSPQKSFCELSGGLIPNYINSGLGI